MSEQPKKPVVGLDGANPQQDPVGALTACIDAWDQLEQQTKLRSAKFLNGDPVTSIQSGQIKRGEDGKVIQQAKEWMHDYLAKNRPDGVFHHPTLGDLQLSAGGVKNSVSKMGADIHVNALPAVPAILENSTVLDKSIDKDGKDIENIILAAPIMVDDSRFYAVVRLRRDVSNKSDIPRFYVVAAELAEDAHKKATLSLKTQALHPSDVLLTGEKNRLLNVLHQTLAVNVVAAANRELEQHYGDEDGNTIGLFDGLDLVAAAGLKQQLDAVDSFSDPIGALAVCLQVWDAINAASTSALSDHYKDENYRYKDVGYIAGSRKELAQSAIMQAKKSGQLVQSTDIDWDALESDTRIAADTIKKSNVFGKPDWEALREGGMEGNAAYLIKRMYAAVALEPDDQSPEGRKLYVTAIQNLRSTFEECKTLDYVIDAMVTYSKLLNTYRNMITLPDGTRDLNYDSKVAHALGKKFRSWIFKTGNTAIRDARKIGDLDWDWMEASDRNTGEAKPKKTRFQLEAAIDIERVGGDAVQIVSTEQFKDKFGLKAVQSGNWVLKDKESIEFHVQHAAEAFVDMADVTGISPELLGFGGRLGLSFGARGKGGALAHYEPVQRVINITKMKGGGSLGHEYFHALDNIIRDLMRQKNDGESGYFATERPDELPDGAIKQAFQALQTAMLMAPQGTTKLQLDDRMRSDIKSVRMSAGLIDRMRAANVTTPARVVEILANTSYSGVEKNKALTKFGIIAVLSAMRQMGMITGDETEVEVPALWEVSQFKQKAVLLDDGKPGKYWSKPLEMAARAYSAYLQDRLAEQGRVNDYLAYSTQGGNSRVGEVAYPQGEERKAINAAFDRVFQAIKAEQVFEKAVQNESLMDDLFGVGQSAEWWIDEEEGALTVDFSHMATEQEIRNYASSF